MGRVQSGWGREGKLGEQGKTVTGIRARVDSDLLVVVFVQGDTHFKAFSLS